MPNFNTQTEEQIINDLTEYGYTWVETKTTSPLVMYFKDTYNTVLKLTVDTTSYAHVYTYVDGKDWREQVDVLGSAPVTDLASLDTLLLVEYVVIDTNILNEAYLTEISNVTTLTPTATAYYTSTIFQDSIGTSYKVSENPSPYRSTIVSWVPITLVGPNWVLTYNNSVIVSTADKVTVSYGNYIVVKI